MPTTSFAARALRAAGDKPRWARCVQIADTSIGGLLGQEYVRRAFTPEAKRKMNELIDNLIAALREDIPRLTWMGPQTQREALAKLDAFKRGSGIPRGGETIRSERNGRSYARNLFAAREYAARARVNRIGKPDDPNEWGAFTPATVNASYNAARTSSRFRWNLQPPFYDPTPTTHTTTAALAQ